MLQPINDFIVPIFFATLGMLVNFDAMFSDWRVVVFGLVVTIAAVISKLLGCGAAALPAGFNVRGGYRIGLGMLPRGEVALIVAGVGLSQNIIGPNVFGVSIMMTLLTTIAAPILLVPAFAHGGTGRRRPERATRRLPGADRRGIDVPCPDDLCPLLISRLLTIAESHGWEPSYEQSDEDIYLLRSGPDAAVVHRRKGKLEIDATSTMMLDFQAFLQEARQAIGNDIEGIHAHSEEISSR